MDLRFAFLPILNVMLFLFFNPWNSNLDVSSISVLQLSMLEVPFLILAIIFLLFFLFTSVELPRSLNPIHFRAGDFSIAVTTSLLASLFFPPSLFWAFYFFIVFSSPWHGMIFDRFKHFFRWFSDTLRSLPTYSIQIVIQNEETSSASPPLQDDIELGFTDDQYHNQQNSEYDRGIGM